MMTIRVAAVALAGTAALTLFGPSASALQTTEPAAPPPRTTWDGVYSEAQATKGDIVYADKCATCHGVDGDGSGAPGLALAGPRFGSKWDGLAVYELFDLTKRTMPRDDPGTLSSDDTVAVIAWMLKKNGFPAGGADLPSSGDALNTIQFKLAK